SDLDRAAQRVHHAPNQRVSNRHGSDAARPADLVPLVDLGVLTHDDHTDDVGFEVKRHSQDAVFKLDEFLGADVVQPRHTCDAVTDLNHGPDIHRAALALKAGDLVEQSPGN